MVGVKLTMCPCQLRHLLRSSLGSFFKWLAIPLGDAPFIEITNHVCLQYTIKQPYIHGDIYRDANIFPIQISAIHLAAASGVPETLRLFTTN